MSFHNAACYHAAVSSLNSENGPSGTTRNGKNVGSARERLIDSFFRILDLKPFAEITITELTKAAGVHRSSFYANFDNTFDLLSASKEEAMRRLFASFPEGNASGEIIDRAHLTPFLRFVKAHPNWYRAYKKNGYLFGERNDFANLLKAVSLPRSGRAVLDEGIVYATSFCLGGIDAAISAWMERGFAEPEEEIAALIEAFAPSRLLDEQKKHP